MKIAVCDDDTADRRRLSTLIKLYCERRSLNAEIEEFVSGAALLRSISHTPYAIVFLDIYLENENGVDVAYTMRKRRCDSVLVFSTVSRDYALDGFAVGARHYLVKPLSYGNVESAMERCGDILASLARTLQLSPRQNSRVLVKDILFVEVLNKTCFIHTPGGVETARKSIGELEQELGGGPFLRCHRSYIVNLEHVQDYENTFFVMQNGMRVPIRQAGRNRIKQAYRDYLSMRVAQNV